MSYIEVVKRAVQATEARGTGYCHGQVVSDSVERLDLDRRIMGAMRHWTAQGGVGTRLCAAFYRPD